jgi:hypothetical protein
MAATIRHPGVACMKMALVFHEQLRGLERLI